MVCLPRTATFRNVARAVLRRVHRFFSFPDLDAWVTGPRVSAAPEDGVAVGPADGSAAAAATPAGDGSAAIASVAGVDASSAGLDAAVDEDVAPTTTWPFALRSVNIQGNTDLVTLKDDKRAVGLGERFFLALDMDQATSDAHYSDNVEREVRRRP